MIPAMDFIRPEDLPETLKFLAQPGKRSKIIAGGTDIIPGLHQGSKRFSGFGRLIAIDHLRELNTIVKRKGYMEIGAAVTFSKLAGDSVIRSNLPLLAEAAGRIGSVQIRNRATIAGNFINNAPCADSAPPLLVYDARIKIRSFKGEREIPLAKFLSGPYKTVLKPNELVTGIILPVPESGTKGVFYKLGRRRGVAVSRISLAILLKRNGVKIQFCRIACGAVTPIAIRLYDLEKKCAGQNPTPEFLKDLSRRVGEEMLHITGLRWSTPYKLPVIQQIFYQLLRDLTGSKT